MTPEARAQALVACIEAAGLADQPQVWAANIAAALAEAETRGRITALRSVQQRLCATHLPGDIPTYAQEEYITTWEMLTEWVSGQLAEAVREGDRSG